MKKVQKMIFLIMVLFLFPSCTLLSSTNKVTTTTYLSPDGKPTRVVVEKELSDDAIYYESAVAAMEKEAGQGTVPANSSPEERVATAGFRTIRAVLGKWFVDRGMNGFEMANNIGGKLVNQSPSLLLGAGLLRSLDKPSEVHLNGEGSRYSPVENKWIGNKGDGNDYSVPYEYQSSDDIPAFEMGEQ